MHGRMTINSSSLCPNLQVHIKSKVEEEFENFNGSFFNCAYKVFNGFLMICLFRARRQCFI